MNCSIKSSPQEMILALPSYVILQHQYHKDIRSYETCLCFQKKAEAAHRILEGLGPHVELVCHINGTPSLEYYLGHLYSVFRSHSPEIWNF